MDNLSLPIIFIDKLFFGFIVAFLFFIQSGESIYEPPHLKITLQHFPANIRLEENVLKTP